eukprot:4578347-Alexandrium_andersonii.AAC.1
MFPIRRTLPPGPARNAGPPDSARNASGFSAQCSGFSAQCGASDEDSRARVVRPPDSASPDCRPAGLRRSAPEHPALQSSGR